MQEPTEIKIYQHCDNLDKGYFYLGNAKIIYKGGDIMTRRIAKAGMEDLFELVNSKLENLAVEKEEAIKLATEKVYEEYAEREDDLKNMLETTSELIEEPDEENVDGETNSEEVLAEQSY